MNFRKTFFIIGLILFLCSLCYADKIVDVQLSKNTFISMENNSPEFTHIFKFENRGESIEILPIQIIKVEENTNQESNIAFFDIPLVEENQTITLPIRQKYDCKPYFLKVEIDGKNTLSDYAGNKFFTFSVDYDWNLCKEDSIDDPSISLTKITFDDTANHLSDNTIEIFGYEEEFPIKISFFSNTVTVAKIDISNDNDFDIDYEENFNILEGTNELILNVSSFEALISDELENIKIDVDSEEFDESFEYELKFRDPIKITKEKVYRTGKSALSSLNTVEVNREDLINVSFTLKREENIDYEKNYIEFDLDNLDLKEVRSESFDLEDDDEIIVNVSFAIPNKDAKTYEIPYTINLFDEFDNKIIINDSFNVKIIDVPHDLRIENFSYGNCEGPLTVSFNLNNKGSANENVKVEIKSIELDFNFNKSLIAEKFKNAKLNERIEIPYFEDEAKFLAKFSYHNEQFFEAFTLNNPCIESNQESVVTSNTNSGSSKISSSKSSTTNSIISKTTNSNSVSAPVKFTVKSSGFSKSSNLELILLLILSVTAFFVLVLVVILIVKRSKKKRN